LTGVGGNMISSGRLRIATNRTVDLSNVCFYQFSKVCYRLFKAWHLGRKLLTFFAKTPYWNNKFLPVSNDYKIRLIIFITFRTECHNEGHLKTHREYQLSE
jgi:hypothetical protein